MVQIFVDLNSGASPVRRDYGRGLTAPQWARFCGRYVCAESIEKFVRTAVPGGAALIADPSTTMNPITSSSSKAAKKAAKSASSDKSRLRLRSKSAGGRSKNENSAEKSSGSSWLSRTFKKAFNSQGESDHTEDELYNADSGGRAYSAGKGGSKSKHSSKLVGLNRTTQAGGGVGLSCNGGGGGVGQKPRLVIPQVEVTPYGGGVIGGPPGQNTMDPLNNTPSDNNGGGKKVDSNVNSNSLLDKKKKKKKW